MACIEKIYSVSALVGSSKCNANCSFCAGKYLRPQSKNDSVEHNLYLRNLETAIKLSARYGGWSLSLTSSGEPTCSPDAVTEALQVYSKCANQGAYFPNVNLFTNGILLGDKDFCNIYLPKWKELGLTNIAVSIHDTDRCRQANVYNLPYSVGWGEIAAYKNNIINNDIDEFNTIGLYRYPSFRDIAHNITNHGIGVRATVLLRKGGIDTVEKFKQSLCDLWFYGFNNITCWSVANPDGSKNEFSLSWWQMRKIENWLRKNGKLCHGHVWGGGVYDVKGNIVRITDYVTKHNPKKNFVRQLVVFQDGVVSYSWIREGALCMR